MKIIKSSVVRTEGDKEALEQEVKAIIKRVRSKGDEALREYNAALDGCTREVLRVSPEEIKNAYETVSADMVQSIKDAAINITTFAIEQKKCLSPIASFHVSSGVELGHRVIPVSSVCCYVPGGNYPLYSTALMLGIPAKVAGVERIIACTPAMKGTEKVNPLTLVAMDIAGIKEIYVTGGPQAIGAAAYGTEEIAPVDMIVGPGNRYVTEAKRQCYGQVGIDFLAGPSEVMVLADGTARPEIIAADLLAQSEHDRMAKGILVTTDEETAEAVMGEVEKQLKEIATADIASVSWRDHGEIMLADSYEEMTGIANCMAPEHLEVMVVDDKIVYITDRLKNYGSLFIGDYAAEAFGDYATGTNHTLPTMAAARYTGGVWVGTFLKICTHQQLDLAGVKAIGPLVEKLAKGETLDAHSKAATKRMELARAEEKKLEEQM